jgi:hypothetical protein
MGIQCRLGNADAVASGGGAQVLDGGITGALAHRYRERWQSAARFRVMGTLWTQ